MIVSGSLPARLSVTAFVKLRRSSTMTASINTVITGTTIKKCQNYDKHCINAVFTKFLHFWHCSYLHNSFNFAAISLAYPSSGPVRSKGWNIAYIGTVITCHHFCQEADMHLLQASGIITQQIVYEFLCIFQIMTGFQNHGRSWIDYRAGWRIVDC